MCVNARHCCIVGIETERNTCTHVQKRGCQLETLQRYPTLEAQTKRYVDCGWPVAHAKDMMTIYGEVLPADERRRIERLEFFDEVEEWRLIQAHYMVCLARNNADTLQQLKLS
jgi:tRNA wybutosine-synthesizing protein 4